MGDTSTPAILRRRKKTMLTLAQKIALIGRHDLGETAQDLAKSFQIGEQTARDIIKQRDKIWKFVQNCETSEGPVKRKSMKVSSFEELDASMLSWYNENRAAGIPVTSAMCIEQAKYLHESLGVKRSFNASSGWLSRFKQRYGISGVYTHSSAKAGSSSNADTFCYQFQQLMQKEELLPDQIYNADETGLQWNSIPSKAGGGSEGSSERITVICCTNATGTHKLDLAIVNKAKNPWNPKDEEFPQRSVNYYEAKGGWASKEIFRHWFEYKWVPEVRQFLSNKFLPLRAILLIDTAPCHITDSALRSDDGCMIVKFMPSDVANLVQPMQQGIVSLLKWNYRTELMKQHQTDDKHLKQRKMDDAMQDLESAWSKISSQTIRNAWMKLVPEVEPYVVENEIIQPNGTTDTCVVMVDHATGLVMDIEEVEGIEEDGVPIEEIQVEEMIQEEGDGESVEIEEEEINHLADVAPEGPIRMEEWFNANDEIIVKEEANMVEVAVEFSELTEVQQPPLPVPPPPQPVEEGGEYSGDENPDRRLELHTALTSVETLLDFVNQRGLAVEDKQAFKKIRTDVRNLMKSLEAKKNNSVHGSAVTFVD